jgi:hypothetical protein
VRPCSACQYAASWPHPARCSLPQKSDSCPHFGAPNTASRRSPRPTLARPARSLLPLASAGAAAEPVLDADGAADFTVSRRIVLDDIDWNVVSQVRFGLVCAVPAVRCAALCCAAALCRMTSIGMCVGMGIAITAATAPVLMAILTAWPCCCRPWAAAPTCSAWRSGTASCRPQWLHAGSGARVTTGACSAPSSSGTGLWLETLTGSGVGVGVCGWCRVVQRPAGAAAGQLLRTQSLAAAVFSMGAPNLHSPCV